MAQQAGIIDEYDVLETNTGAYIKPGSLVGSGLSPAVEDFGGD